MFITDKKKSKGEVFTSVNLVIEMLDKLQQEVWSDKDLKWLDPSMIGTGKEIPDIEKRRKHK